MRWASLICLFGKEVPVLSIEIKEVQLKNYGKCLSMNNGKLNLLVTIDVGPRIIWFGPDGGPNLLYQDNADLYTEQGEAFDKVFGPGSCYHLYGGHRLWLAPEQIPESYYPDNEPVIYSLLPDGVRFTPPCQRPSEIQLSLEIMMAPQAQDVMILHAGQNCSDKKRQFALWGITAMAPGGTLYVPQNPEKDTLLANRAFAFWPYSHINDDRFYMGDRYITLQQNQVQGAGKNSNRFKVGCNNFAGWCAYVNQGMVFTKRYVHNKDVRYTDFGCSFEAYVDDNLLEIETFSPLYHVEPQETIKHVENWSVFPAPGPRPAPRDEDAIAQYFA